MVTKNEAFLRRMQIGTKEWRSRIALYEELSRSERDEGAIPERETELALQRHLSVLEAAVRELETCPTRDRELVRVRVRQAWDALAEAWNVASSELDASDPSGSEEGTEGGEGRERGTRCA